MASIGTSWADSVWVVDNWASNAWAQADVTVSGTTDALTLATYGATVDAAGDVSINAGVDALTLMTNAADVMFTVPAPTPVGVPESGGFTGSFVRRLKIGRRS